MKGFNGVDRGWGAIVHTQPRIVTSLHQFQLEDDAHGEADSFATHDHAAEKGYIPAIYAIGLCLLTGDRVEQDVSQAAAYFEWASNAGYPPAMYEFGLALFHGNGVAMDVPRAVSLIRASAQAGDEYAREFLLAHSLDVGP